MAQRWEKVTARQTANYNKKHNYRTFEYLEDAWQILQDYWKYYKYIKWDEANN